MYLNKLDNDGEILQLRKDGTTVGSIGGNSSDIYIGSGDTGLYFSTSNSAIYPVNTATGAGSDATTDIGYPTRRVKDLYLSGGVYLGGTGAANKLDDYEEGTWTPTVTANSGTQPTIVYGARYGSYTKIGNLVTIQGYFNLSSVSGTVSGVAQIGGLPFTISSSGSDYSVGNFTGNGLNFSRPACPGFTRISVSSFGFLSSSLDNTGWGWETVSIFTSTDEVRLSITYQTDQ